MIFNKTMMVMGMTLIMIGCVGSEENTSESGLVLHLAETHYQANEVAGQLAPAPGAYAQDQLEHHNIRDKNNVQLSLYRAYLVVDDIELISCPSVAQWSQRLFDFLIPSAYAHAGHGSEPVGSRALDKPNVIDLNTQDEFILPLGDSAIAPGRYCGVQVSLIRLAGDAYGKPEFAAASTDNPITVPEIPDMVGKIFTIRGDYCSERDSDNNCIQRQAINIDDAGSNEPEPHILNFSTPLELNSTLREGYVTFGIEYDTWLENIDVTLLNSDPNEQQTLLNNIRDSLRAYNHGLGDLPTNTSDD